MSTEATAATETAAEEALIAQGLQQRQQKTAKPADPAKPAEDPKPEAAKPADPAKPAETLEAKFDRLFEENKQLREKMEAFAKGEGTREATRRGEDARENFIRDRLSPELPRDIMRKLLPAVENEGDLDKAAKPIVEAFKAFAKKYKENTPNIGGNQGGQSIGEYAKTLTFANPVAAIAAGLGRRRQ